MQGWLGTNKYTVLSRRNCVPSAFSHPACGLTFPEIQPPENNHNSHTEISSNREILPGVSYKKIITHQDIRSRYHQNKTFARDARPARLPPIFPKSLSAPAVLLAADEYLAVCLIKPRGKVIPATANNLGRIPAVINGTMTRKNVLIGCLRA